MRQSLLPLLLVFPLLLSFTTGCVMQSKYDDLETSAMATRVTLEKQIKALEADLAATRGELEEANGSLTKSKAKIAELEARIAKMERERAALLADKSSLKASIDDMASALAELERRRIASERRVAAFQDMLSRFKKLIDAGTLQVKIVDGRMVVQLKTDILFDSGSAKLSEDGAAALAEVAAVLQSIPDRKYQVEGHTDDDPIKTAQYPSNWELASGRALVVVKTMIAGGLMADRVSAASYGEFKPTASNEDKAGKAQNRRIEIVVLPDLSDLPGFDELQTIGK